MGIDKTLIASHLSDLLPSRIRTKVLEDGSLIAKYGPFTRTTVTIGVGPSFDQLELFRAIRQSFATHMLQEINDINGHQFLVSYDHDTVVLKKSDGMERKELAKLHNLMILSPNQPDRVRALNRLLDRLGPTTPGFSTLKVSANERAITDLEAAELLEEVSNGFEAHRARITMAHSANRILLDDIVPDALSYYERFCGPVPYNIPPEEYLTRTLPSYRRQLLSRNLVQGLDICLLGSLRDDLAPAAWLDAVGDEELLPALKTIDLRGNPFALLGALDIALTRQHHQGFMTLAEETIAVLLLEQLPRPDGMDAYELLPLFAQLVLDRINVIEGGASCEPFWKRMCAWMHAGLLMHSTLGVEIKMEMFRKWADSNRSTAGTYAQMIDLHREPMYRAGQVSRSYLREEIIGRLVILQIRHQAASRTVPHSKAIDEARTCLSRKGSPLGWGMPGPLDGHLRPAQQEGRKLSSADVDDLLKELSMDSSGVIWSKLAYFSQCFDLGEAILAGARESCAKMILNVDSLEEEPKRGRLFDMCLVAAAHRDKDLARAIAATVLKMAPHTETREGTLSILHSLILASAAFEKEDEWSYWIKEQLGSLANNLPAGDATELLCEHLSEMKLLPLSWSVCSHAEAVSSAAN